MATPGAVRGYRLRYQLQIDDALPDYGLTDSDPGNLVSDEEESGAFELTVKRGSDVVLRCVQA